MAKQLDWFALESIGVPNKVSINVCTVTQVPDKSNRSRLSLKIITPYINTLIFNTKM